MDSYTLSIIAGLMIILVMLIYFKQVVRGVSKPNTATWIIWVTVGVMNTVSYYDVVGEAKVLWFISVMAVSGASLVFLYSIKYGKFQRPSRTDLICLALACLIGVYWQMSGDSTGANIALQVIYIISFIPTAQAVRKDPSAEGALPWGIAAFAYIVQIFAILVEGGESMIWQLFYPVVNGVGGNGTIFMMILYLQKKQRQPTGSASC